MAASVRDVAEDAFAYIARPGIELDEQPDLVFRNLPHPHPSFGMVLRQRLGDVSVALARARRWFAEREREVYTWMVADSATPSDLSEQLLELGVVPAPDDPVFAGMVLAQEPEGASGVDVRPVTNFEDFVAANEVAWRSFAFTEEQQAELRPQLRDRYEALRTVENAERFVALVDGEIVGSASSIYLPCGVFLAAGNVAPEARGRGVYRTLVRARWDAAVRRGTPTLVVQAGAMSKPILDRLGFETICTVRAFRDRTTSDPG